MADYYTDGSFDSSAPNGYGAWGWVRIDVIDNQPAYVAHGSGRAMLYGDKSGAEKMEMMALRMAIFACDEDSSNRIFCDNESVVNMFHRSSGSRSEYPFVANLYRHAEVYQITFSIHWYERRSGLYAAYADHLTTMTRKTGHVCEFNHYSHLYSKNTPRATRK